MYQCYVHHIWDKVFRNGASEICGRQPLKKLKRVWSALGKTYRFNFLRAVFRKLFLVHSWIIWFIYHGSYLPRQAINLLVCLVLSMPLLSLSAKNPAVNVHINPTRNGNDDRNAFWMKTKLATSRFSSGEKIQEQVTFFKYIE